MSGPAVVLVAETLRHGIHLGFGNWVKANTRHIALFNNRSRFQRRQLDFLVPLAHPSPSGLSCFKSFGMGGGHL